MDKKCVVFYDSIENGNEFHRNIQWTKIVISDERDQNELCCSEMIKTFDEFKYHDEGKIGISYSDYYGDMWLSEFKYCPYCGAIIEYKLHKKQRYVNRPEPKWVLIDIE